MRQTKNQNKKNEEKITSFLTVDLKKFIDYNIKRYKKTFENKLGMDEDDIYSDMMFQIWKGIVTHDKTKKANLKTYINTLLNNRFKLLAKKSAAKKFSIITYMDCVGDNVSGNEDSVYSETGESLLEKREQIMQNIQSLQGIERDILKDLISGKNMEQMAERNKVPRPVLTTIIKKIDVLIISKRKEL